MGLGDCEGCWDAACCCEDGKGWRAYSLHRLVQIQAAVNAAVATKRAAGESDADPWKKPAGKPGDPA